MTLINQVTLTLRSVLSDRILHAICGVAVLLVVLVPVFSSFSMRQVQESSIGLALSASSLVLLVLATQLGASSVFREVDRRYTSSVLTLPLSRGEFVAGRFLGLSLFLLLTTIILACGSALVILYATSTYPSARPIAWLTLFLAFGTDLLKYILLMAIAMFFSTLSTSFTLPFFCTLAVYLAGSASQEVFEYITGSLGDQMPAMLRTLTELTYYLLPNFSSFDLHVQAVYGLDVNLGDVALSLLYAVVYTSIVLWAAIVCFKRRELP